MNDEVQISSKVVVNLILTNRSLLLEKFKVRVIERLNQIDRRLPIFDKLVF